MNKFQLKFQPSSVHESSNPIDTIKNDMLGTTMSENFDSLLIENEIQH